MTLVLWPKRQPGCLAADSVTYCQKSDASLHAQDFPSTKLLLIVCKEDTVVQVGPLVFVFSGQVVFTRTVLSIKRCAITIMPYTHCVEICSGFPR